MWRVSFAFFISAYAVVVQARGPPNAEFVQKYIKSLGPEGSRFSNNLLEDASLDVPNLIRKYGYPAEVHNVVTEDGYILELHRIPYGRDQNNFTSPEKPVILLVHGLFASSADWVLMGPGTAFGYILAEADFDVWMGNVRGTYYSRRHITMDPDTNMDYWQFSWEEFGRFDLPAMIDHILEVTGKSRIHYVGHSQGTTSFWAMGSLRPEYNDKIITMQAYAPVAYMHFNDNPVFNALGPIANNIEMVARLLGIGELLSRPEFAKLAGRTVCNDGSPLQPICTNLLFLMVGDSHAQFNATMFPVKLAHTPAGAAVRQLVHYGQHIGREFFRRFDHGPLGNWQRYGSFTPPSFDLRRITSPVYLHYVVPDTFAHIKDVQRLRRELGRPMALLRVPSEPFSHLDFAWGQNAKDVLYDRTINIMRVHGNN